MVDFITSAEGKEVTLNGWIVVSIYDTISLDIGKLPAMDPYHDIDPLVNESNIPVATNLKAVSLIKTKLINSTLEKVKMRTMIIALSQSVIMFHFVIKSL